MFECRLCQQVEKFRSFFQSQMFTHLKTVHGCSRRGLYIEVN